VQFILKVIPGRGVLVGQHLRGLVVLTLLPNQRVLLVAVAVLAITTSMRMAGVVVLMAVLAASVLFALFGALVAHSHQLTQEMFKEQL
jgi:hypothetical protein